jgi:two-component system response regulator MprA
MRGTVLLAEDDRGLREVLLHVLGEAGYQVVLVSAEADTLAAVQRAHAHCLLLLEARLPGGATESILRKLGESNDPTRCPVVLLSSGPVETRSTNVVGVLRKPFELTRMLGLVRAFCPSPTLPLPPARGSRPQAA